jgi:hypothetical protein
MAKDTISRGDIFLITLSNSSRFLGKFEHCHQRGGEGTYLYFSVFDIDLGNTRILSINEGNILLKSIVPVDRTVWDKAVKVRDVYLNTLRRLCDAYEGASKDGCDDDTSTRIIVESFYGQATGD